MMVARDRDVAVSRGGERDARAFECLSVSLQDRDAITNSNHLVVVTMRLLLLLLLWTLLASAQQYYDDGQDYSQDNLYHDYAARQQQKEVAKP